MRPLAATRVTQAHTHTVPSANLMPTSMRTKQAQRTLVQGYGALTAIQ